MTRIAEYPFLASLGAGLAFLLSMAVVAPATAAEPDKGKVPTVCTGCVTEARLGQTVKLNATVADQCRGRGCWLRLKDDAGELMVDLGPKKLDLTGDRVGQKAAVTGKVVKKGDKLWVEAETVNFSPAEKKDPPPAEKR